MYRSELNEPRHSILVIDWPGDLRENKEHVTNMVTSYKSG